MSNIIFYSGELIANIIFYSGELIVNIVFYSGELIANIIFYSGELIVNIVFYSGELIAIGSNSKALRVCSCHMLSDSVQTLVSKFVSLLLLGRRHLFQYRL